MIYIADKILSFFLGQNTILKESGMLSDFPGNRDYPGKSLWLTRESWFPRKVATYLDTAVTTFWENKLSLVSHSDFPV